MTGALTLRPWERADAVRWIEHSLDAWAARRRRPEPDRLDGENRQPRRLGQHAVEFAFAGLDAAVYRIARGVEWSG